MKGSARKIYAVLRDDEAARQDYQQAADAVRQGLQDVKAGRTKPADEFLASFALKYGLSR
jgi:hypothetical protein